MLWPTWFAQSCLNPGAFCREAVNYVHSNEELCDHRLYDAYCGRIPDPGEIFHIDGQNVPMDTLEGAYARQPKEMW